ncbi:MAG: NUDIX domain-containing protein [Candidatus Dormibacteria bacterium]|jgi:8-oxo-dGTP pyrophosphatase MutT (NUDIX family)
MSGGERRSSRFAQILFHDRPPRWPLRSVVIDGEPWPVGGAQLAVLHGGRVLLQLRPWPPGWELPGGHCKPDEEPADAAARETEEETGHTVRVLGLVGVYSWEGLRAAGDAVFLGEITGGRARRSIEAWSVRLFDPHQLPRTVFPWCRERILDAVACSEGGAPVHRVQPVTMRHVMNFGTSWMQTPVDALTRHRRPRRTGG